MLDCLDDDPDQLDREIDWVIKRKMIRVVHRAQRHHAGTTRACSCSTCSTTTSALNRGLYYLLERDGAVERVLDDDEIIKAKTEPPPDTRARMRGEFIKLARQNSIQYDLDWSNIRLGNLLNVRVICNNPFETDTEKVAELVRTIQKTNLRKTSLSKLVIQS